MEGKLSILLFSPILISFNDNTIETNFYPRKFHSSKLFKDLPPTWREFTLVSCSGRSGGGGEWVPGGPVPLIRHDACLRLKLFLHWQDRISLFNWLFFFLTKRALHFATKLNSRDIQKCKLFLGTLYDVNEICTISVTKQKRRMFQGCILYE